MEVLTSLPRQKLPYADKDQKWRERCVDSIVALHATRNNRRSSYHDKRRNYDLYNGKIDEKDFEFVTNPLRLQNSAFQLPASIKPYDIISPIFNFLIGEESKRPFNPIVRAVNEDAISQKEIKQKEQILAGLQQLLADSLSPDPKNPNDLDKKLNELSGYTYQDMRERVANHLLTYFRKHPEFNLQKVFEDGWKDALLTSEEMYKVVDIAGHPALRRVNPLELSFELPHNSDYIDEAEKILEKTRMTYSQIIDDYYEYLTDEQIEYIEDLQQGSIYAQASPIRVQDIESINDLLNYTYGPGMDLFIVTWKSKRKVGTYKYLDENGQEQEELVDETFKLTSPRKGESVEWFWINEYWEGCRIGVDIYPYIRPKRQQFKSIYNLSKCKSGYFGTVYSSTNSQSVSLMDRLVPWIYIYLVTWFRTEHLMAANQGKIANVNISQIPDGWEIEKWLYYASAMKIFFNNPFNEGKKGEAQGKLAGHVSQQTNSSIDMELGNSIQYNIQLLNYIEKKIQDTSGISQQRLGTISPNELVGNTERSIVQSSYQTELYFRIHNHVKIRSLTALIQLSKDIYEDKKQFLQYMTDDLATVIFELDGTEFSDADYGVFLTDSLKDQDALNTLKQHIQAALQNDKIDFSNIIDVFNSDSLADLKNKLKKGEEERSQMQQQAQQNQSEAIKEQTRVQKEIADRNFELKQYEIDQNNSTKIEVAQLQTYFQKADLDANNNGIPDIIDIEKLAFERQKLAQQDLHARLESTTKQSLEDKKISLEREKMQAAKDLEKLKGENDIKTAKARPISKK